MYNFEKGGWWSGDKAVSRVQGGVHEGVGGAMCSINRYHKAQPLEDEYI